MDLNVNTTESMEASRLKMYAEQNGVDIGKSTSVRGITQKIKDAGKEVPDFSEVLEPAEVTQNVEQRLDDGTNVDTEEPKDETAIERPKSVKPVRLEDKDLDDMTVDEILKLAQIEEAKNKIREARKAKRERITEAEITKGSVNMKDVISKQKEVEVRIPWSPGQPQTIPVVVNGIRRDVPVNQWVKLPKSHAEVLEESQDEKYKNYMRSKAMEQDFKSFKNVIYK